MNASTFDSQITNKNSKLSWIAESKVGQLFCTPGLCHVHTIGIQSHTCAKDTSSLLSNASTFDAQITNENSKLSWNGEYKVQQLSYPPDLCHVHTVGIRSHTCAKDTSSMLSNGSTFDSGAMDKIVVKKASPPPFLGVYRGEIAAAVARKGLLTLAPDQLTGSMFNPQKTRWELAHCRTLYKNIHNGKPPKTLVEDFIKVWVARVKAMAPKKQSDAKVQLQADLTAELEERWLQSDQKLLDMFGDVVKAAMESYNAMPPSLERMSRGTSIECLKKVHAAWHKMPPAERNINVLHHLFQEAEGKSAAPRPNPATKHAAVTAIVCAIVSATIAAAERAACASPLNPEWIPILQKLCIFDDLAAWACDHRQGSIVKELFAESNQFLLACAQAKQCGVQWDAKLLDVIPGCGSALTAWRNGSSQEATLIKCLQTVEMLLAETKRVRVCVKQKRYCMRMQEAVGKERSSAVGRGMLLSWDSLRQVHWSMTRCSI